MAANRLRFFPTPTIAPSLNGNGAKAHAPDLERKGYPGSGITLTLAPAQFWPIDGNGHTTRDLSDSSLSWYAGAWLAYACMSYRATKLSEAPLWIREEKDGSEAWLTGPHELAALLKRPNPDMRMRAFLFRTSLLLDGTGRCVWLKVRDRGNRVVALRPYGADQVLEIRSTEERMFGRFHLQQKDEPKWYEAEDVIHLYNEDPADPMGCVAPLDAAADRLGIERKLIRSIKSGLDNAVVPGSSVYFDPAVFGALTLEQIREYQAAINAQYAEARNHGKTFVSNGQMERHKLGFEGLHGGELSKETEAAVCSVFQIPPVIIGAYVGLANSSDRHNLETSVEMVYENAIEPAWARIEEAMTDDLLAEVDDNPLRFVRVVKTGVSRYQQDLAEQSDISTKTADILTINERRALLGYQALEGEEGDRLAPVAPALLPEGDAVKRDGGPAERKADEDQWRVALFEASTRGQELGWQIEAAVQLEADRAALVSLAEKILRPGTKDDDPGFAPADPETVRELIKAVAAHMDLEAAVQWRARVEPLTAATARRAVERVVAELGLSFDLLQPGLLEYVEKEAAWLVTHVTDTTKQEIRAALTAGLAEGESVPQLTARIQEATAFTRERAELIARTETTRVTNGGQRDTLAAYQAESGDRITKRWLTARDARVRDEHRALEGQTREVNEAFSNGLQAPGEPNCRCTLAYSLEG